VKVRSAGICSSDLHMIASGFRLNSTLGHEVAGVLSDGRAVALEPIAPCGHCDMCLKGDYHLCRLGTRMVHGVARDGGMAEEIVVPARCIVPLPNNVSASDACLVEPLAVAAHGIRMLNLKPSDRVAVIGAGAVGLTAAAVLTPHINDISVAARHDGQKLAADLRRQGHRGLLYPSARRKNGQCFVAFDPGVVQNVRPGASWKLVWNGTEDFSIVGSNVENNSQ